MGSGTVRNSPFPAGLAPPIPHRTKAKVCPIDQLTLWLPRLASEVIRRLLDGVSIGHKQAILGKATLHLLPLVLAWNAHVP